MFAHSPFLCAPLPPPTPTPESPVTYPVFASSPEQETQEHLLKGLTSAKSVVWAATVRFHKFSTQMTMDPDYKCVDGRAPDEDECRNSFSGTRLASLFPGPAYKRSRGQIWRPD